MDEKNKNTHTENRVSYTDTYTKNGIVYTYKLGGHIAFIRWEDKAKCTFLLSSKSRYVTNPPEDYFPPIPMELYKKILGFLE